MYIPIWEKMYLSYAAKKDAEGEYGRFLIHFQSKLEKSPSADIVFKPSNFMKHLANDYRIKCENKIIHRRFYVLWLDKRILKKYYIVDKQIKENSDVEISLQKDIQNMENEISSLQTIIEGLNQEIAKANSGQNAIDVLTSLYSAKEDKEEEIKKIEIALASKRADKAAKINEGKRSLDSVKSSFKRLIPNFRTKIKALLGVTKNVEIKQEAKFYIYWHALNKHFNFDLPNIPFYVMCQLCDVHMKTIDDIFPEERKFINNEVKKLVGFELEV